VTRNDDLVGHLLAVLRPSHPHRVQLMRKKEDAVGGLVYQLELLPPEKPGGLREAGRVRVDVCAEPSRRVGCGDGWGQVSSAMRWRLWARAMPPTQVCAPGRLRKRVRRRPLRLSWEMRPSSPLRKR
jgi:hypothetical protein